MLTVFIRLLADNPLLLLFVVTGLGHLVGRLKFRGFSLGVAAVLFVGLAFGALDATLSLPDIIYQLGLALFVYTLGLSSGPSLASSFRRRGLRDTLFAVGSLLGTGAITLVIARLVNLPGPIMAGVFTGSLTSTPALAGVLDFLSTQAAGSADISTILSQPVVGYSVAYPIGVLGVMLSIHFLTKWWRVDLAAESTALGYKGKNRIMSVDVEVNVSAATGIAVRALHPQGTGVFFSRLWRHGDQMMVDGNTMLQLGDIVTLVGPEDDIERYIPTIGQRSDMHPQFDRSKIDTRTIFLSNTRLAGRPIKELNLQQTYGVTISRIRRGDVVLLASGSSILELGDQLQVVGPRDKLSPVADFFGDSFRHLGEVDLISVSVGVTLGLLLGLVPIPLGGGVTFKLGFAGGPLVVALLLGALGRSRRLVWILPYNANLTVRQLGLVLFLAAIGTQAGTAFGGTLSAIGLPIALAALLLTLLYSGLTLFIGYKLLNIPLTVMYGLLAGIQTQSATLAFVNERTENDLPSISYATVYPTAMIIKILLTQVLASILGLH